MTLSSRPRAVVALGAHPDDIEIGAGGTLLTMARRWPGLDVTVLVLTGTEQRRREARTACDLFLEGARVHLVTADLPDGRLPAHWDEVKQRLEDVAADAAAGPAADLVLAPRTDDAHQDHRLLAELAPTVWRDQLILGYEVPKFDGDGGRANAYVPLEPQIAREKVRLLDKAYPSQVGRDWWDEETFLGQARRRGIECRTRYAEAFVASKLVLSW